MRKGLCCSILALAFVASPAFAKTKHTPPVAPSPKVVTEMPEIIIEMPKAKFEHAILRDNEIPVVLLLV